jgi:hypothetical protein
LTGWINGDFNYDGKINIDDYTTVIDANIGNQTGVLPAADGVQAVPEPVSIAGWLLPVGLMVRRRRLRKVRPNQNQPTGAALLRAHRPLRPG